MAGASSYAICIVLALKDGLPSCTAPIYHHKDYVEAWQIAGRYRKRYPKDTFVVCEATEQAVATLL